MKEVGPLTLQFHSLALNGGFDFPSKSQRARVSDAQWQILAQVAVVVWEENSTRAELFKPP